LRVVAAPSGFVNISGLTITPPAGATTFALSVQAISTEDNQTSGDGKGL